MIVHWLEQILAAPDTGALETALFDAMAECGFQHTFYSARFLLSLPKSLVRGQAIIISNLPPTIEREWVQAGVVGKSHWARWVHENDGDISSLQLIKDSEGQPVTQMMVVAQRLGMQASQIISLRDRVLRCHGALIVNPGFGASHEEVADLWARHGRDIRALARVFHMRVATMRREGGKLLTPRQREVLEWRSAGKTVSEIATIIGVTPATVEKHMRLAREALGAETTAQAILKAHVAQELFPDDGTQNPFE